MTRRNQMPPLPDLPPVTSARERVAQRRAAKNNATASSTESSAAPTPWQQQVRRIRRGIRMALLLALLLLSGAVLLFYREVRAVADAIVVPEVRSNPSAASPLLGGTNILLIGVDERPDHPEEGVRSDTLILAHLSAMGKWVNLLSIPRDTQVDMPGIGPTKINVAYGHGYASAAALYGEGVRPQQGGMAFAAETVEQFLGASGRRVRADYTVQINFDGFVQIIDALGGITIDVPYHIVDDAYPTPDYGTMYVEFLPGPQRMDGATALIYARTRHADSDFHRSQRQQQVLRAVVQEFRQRPPAARIAALPALLRSVKGRDGAPPPITTTLPIDRLDVIAAMVLMAAQLSPESVGQVPINPETVPVTEVGSNLLWDMNGIGSRIDAMLHAPEPSEEP